MGQKTNQYKMLMAHLVSLSGSRKMRITAAWMVGVFLVSCTLQAQYEFNRDTFYLEFKNAASPAASLSASIPYVRQLYEASRYKTVLPIIDSMLVIADQRRSLNAKSTLLFYKGAALTQVGLRQQAEAVLEDANGLTRSLQNLPLQSSCLAFLALNENALGDTLASKSHLEESHQLALKAKDAKALGIEQYVVASLYRKKGDLMQAESAYTACLTHASHAHDPWLKALGSSGLGTVAGIHGQLQIAMGYFNDALANAAILENKVWIGDALHHLANVYFFQGKNGEALSHYIRALDIRLELQDSSRLGDSYHDIGNVYKAQDRFEDALTNYSKAQAFFLRTGNKERIAKAFHSIGLAHVNLGHTKEAFQNLNQALRLQSEIGDVYGSVPTLTVLAQVYTQEGQTDAAIETLRKAIVIGDSLQMASDLSTCYTMLGDLWLQKDSLALAYRCFEKCIEFGNETGNNLVRKETFEKLIRLDSLRGDMNSALAHFRSFTYFADKYNEEIQDQNVSALILTYEIKQKDLEIDQLESDRVVDSLKLAINGELLGRTQEEKERIRVENLNHLQAIALLSRDKEVQQLVLDKKQFDLDAQQAETAQRQNKLTLMEKEREIQRLRLNREMQVRNYLLIGLVVSLLLSYLIYRLFITRHKLKIQTLRNRIATDLHDDVGSTLSSIAIFSEMAQMQSAEVRPLLQTIEDSSRNMLDAMADIVWTIHPENDQLEKIILRMKGFAYDLLGAKEIDFEFRAESELGHLSLPMNVRKNLYLIFKEATNNLVKYAEANKVYYHLSKNKNHLVFDILDNGKGFDVHSTYAGNGLRNMKKRAEEMGGRLLIQSFPGMGTKINLEINLS